MFFGMSDFSDRGHDQPVFVDDEEKNERLAAEKALAWLKAILRQTDARMITAESLERALTDAPEAEVADILQQKVTDLMLEVYYSSGNTGQVKGSEDAVQIYLAFLDASTAMTPHEFSAVERLHHELKHHFSQLAMLKPRNKEDEAIIHHLEWVKNKFEAAAGDFAEAKEFVAASVKGDLVGDIKERMAHEADEIAEGRELSLNEQISVDRLRSSLDSVFFATEPDEKEANPESLIKDLHDLGQHKEVIEVISAVNVYVRDFLALPLEDQSYRDVRYFYKLMLNDLVVLSTIYKVLKSEEREVANSLKAIIEEKMPEVEKLVAQFAADKEIQLEDKVDKYKDDFDNCIFNPSEEAIKVFKPAIEGLQNLQREDVVLELLQDQISEAKMFFDKTYDLEWLQKWLEKSHARLELLDSLGDIKISEEEAQLLEELRRCWIEKMQDTQKLIERIIAEDENQVEEAMKLKKAQGSLLGTLGKHAGRLEAGEKAELTAEQGKLLGLLRRHEDKIEMSEVPEQINLSEAEALKLQGRLFLFVLQKNVGELQKTVDLLRIGKRSDLVLQEISEERGRAILSDFVIGSGEHINVWLKINNLTVGERAALQDWQDYVEIKKRMWDSNSARHKAEYEAEQEMNKASRLADFKRWLSGEEEGDKGFAQGCLNDLHGQKQFAAVEQLLQKELRSVGIEGIRDFLVSEDAEKIAAWIKRTKNVLAVFDAISEDYKQPNERAIELLYRQKTQFTLPRMESRLQTVLKGQTKEAVEKKEVDDLAKQLDRALIGDHSGVLNALNYVEKLIAKGQRREIEGSLVWLVEGLNNEVGMNRILESGKAGIALELEKRARVLTELANLDHILNGEEKKIVERYKTLEKPGTQLLKDKLEALRAAETEMLLDKWAHALYDDDANIEFAKSLLYSLHENKAFEDAAWKLRNEVRLQLDDARTAIESGGIEEVNGWLKHQEHLLGIFGVIANFATSDEKAVEKEYTEDAQILEVQIKAKRDKLLGKKLVDVKPVDKVAGGAAEKKELSDEERREIVTTQLSLGSFGYAEQLLAKWWPDNERWFTDSELRQAAQEGIEKQWKEKPLMRSILEKFIKKFELYTPVEPKPVRKSKKNI